MSEVPEVFEVLEVIRDVNPIVRSKGDPVPLKDIDAPIENIDATKGH